MRKAGILLPISALNSKYGIGALSKEAFAFVDWLKKSGQSYWQILPLGPTGFGDSPYQPFSAFAGNPYYISLENLVEEGLLTKEECDKADLSKEARTVDYEKIYQNRVELLHLAYERSNYDREDQYLSFVSENVRWLEDYALFMAVKDYYHGEPWYNWEMDIKMHNPKALEEYNEKLNSEVNFWKFLQYKFYMQWYELKQYANENGIKIIGDIPIYVAYDSADVWSLPALFDLNENKAPISVAGCPPDGFSKNGQLWGNPLYKWSVHKETGFVWWIYRIEHCFKLFDTLRIDHFRGFDEYYAIDFGNDSAKNGEWRKGPGKELFDMVFRKLGKKDIIAEDLGFITEEVKELLDYCEFPGMRVFQFGFDERDVGSKNEHLPHNYNENCIAYTGTHDNSTIVSWYFEISEEEREAVRDYLFDYLTPNSEINYPIIGAMMKSQAKIVIIPLQDYLGFDSRARINKPATIGNNWTWRTIDNDFSSEITQKILAITKATGR